MLQISRRNSCLCQGHQTTTGSDGIQLRCSGGIDRFPDHQIQRDCRQCLVAGLGSVFHYTNANNITDGKYV